MAGRLAYYNHNYQQHHNQFLRHYPSTSFSSASIVSPSNLDSSSFSSSSSTSSSSTSTSPSACLTSSASQSLAGSSAGVAAAAAAAAAVDLPSHPQSIQPQHSLSSWAEWPADQLQNRPLGSVEDTGKGKGTSTSTSSSSSLSKGLVGIRNRTRTVGSAPRTRRLASSSSSSSPRHIHQRSARRMNRRPPASSSDSASPPSLLRCCSGSDDCKTSPGAPNPTMISSTNNNTASNTTDATSISVAAAPPPNIMPDATPRPGKRSTDGSTPDDPTSHAAGKLKLPRLERGPDDFSSVVKNRLQSYTRTGQACDRCKVRKIRCDALPEGCSHCINLNLDCYVTDRVTGRTERRGYMQQLEREKNGMLSYIRELEKLLGDNGVDVKPWQGPASAPQNVDENLDAPPSSSSSAANDWTQSGSVWVKSKSPSSNSSSATPSISLRPKLRASSSTDIDEQIQTDGNEIMALKSIKGTKLRLLDMEIDTAGFEAPEMDEPADPLNAPVPLYKRSFQAFLQSTYKINPIIQMEMPSRHDAFTFCDWYFLVFAPFFPILHKPTFMRMVTRIYDEPGFEPNDCEQLTLHTVFAIIYHNYGVRNWQLEGRIHFTSLADKHYHFALSKFYDVLSRHDLPAVQALTLLAIYMRSFPKPKLATHVIGLALEKAMNLGLHRKDETPSSGTNINKELRKRVWWSIVAVAVFTFGRLGRPMIITSHEFDTDLPEPIADEHLKEHGVDAEQTVAFQYGVGLALQKLTKISIEIYTHLYSARRDLSQYSQILEVLEEQLQEWDTALPDHLRLDKPLHPDTMVQPYYTRMFFLEIRLCLRHPSLAPATDKQLREENSRITEEISREMLKLALEVIKYRAIDTSWYHVSLFVVCIFSTLSVNWDRRFEMSPEKMAMLRDEMGRWLSVIKDVCILMGNGPGFLFEVTRIVDRTVSWIEHDMNGQDFNKSLSSPPTLLSQTLGPTGFDYTRAAAAVPVTLGPAGTAPNLRSFYGKGTSTDQAGFSVLPYGAQPQGAGAMPAYTSEQAIFYSTSMQPATTSLVTVAPNEPSLQTNPLMAFATQSTQHVGPSSQTDMMWQNRGPTWNDWESTVADNQDRYNNSNILNFTAGSRGSLPSDDAVDQAPVDIGFLPHSQWPMNLFENGPDNGPSGV